MSFLRRLFQQEEALLCPFCFDEFYLSKAPFRCTAAMSTCAPQKDEVLEREWEIREPVSHVIRANGRDAARCDVCSTSSDRRICPNCHQNLPRSIGVTDQLIIAMVGAKDSGKSHYIAVLLTRLLQEVGPTLEFNLRAASDQTRDIYNERYRDQVYKEKKIIPLTRSADADPKTRIPLVYEVTFHGTDLVGAPVVRGGVTLVFFDTAGEDLEKSDVMARVNKYIYRAHGIILLLDPLQLPAVRNRLPEGTGLPPESRETREIMERVTELIESGRKLGSHAMIDTPLAVAFSKFDALAPIVGEQLQMSQSSRHLEGFDLDDFEALNDEMHSFVSRWGAADLLNLIRSRYERYAFFGVSALGCNPHGTSKIPHVLPSRVEDPFLWILHQHRLLRGTRR